MEPKSALELIESIDESAVQVEIAELKGKKSELDKQIESLEMLLRIASVRKNGIAKRGPKKKDLEQTESGNGKPYARELTKTEAAIVSGLESGPKKIAEISRAVGIDYGTVYSAIKKMPEVVKQDDDRYALV